MLKFEWNALRQHDHVVVHDSSRPDLALVPGVVALVDCHKGANQVGIAITAADGDRQVVWPTNLAVHRKSLDPLDPREPCWRCDALRDAARRASAALAVVPGPSGH